MNCPQCGKGSDVVDSRIVPDGVRRRRICLNEHRFTTYEVSMEEVLLLRQMKALLASPPKVPRGFRRGCDEAVNGDVM